MTFGFIGAGNMGGALARAAARAMDGKSIFLADQNTEKAAALARELDCCQASAQETAASCRYIFLGVKPQVLGSVLETLAPVFKQRQDRFVLVCMAAGVAMKDILTMAGGEYPLIRIMPNLPVSAGSGVIVYDKTGNVTPAEEALFLENMRYAGTLDFLPEALIDAASALSGSGPAFVSLFVQALAEGAAACGLPDDKALAYALGTVKGTAQMLLESGTAPRDLAVAVCSPGGSTIEGVKVLEQQDLEGCVRAAVAATYRRAVELGK